VFDNNQRSGWIGIQALDFLAKKLQKLLKIYEKQRKIKKALKSITD
jgi:hypothetical protein